MTPPPVKGAGVEPASLTLEALPGHLSTLAGQLAEITRQMEPDFIRLGNGLNALHRGAADLGRVASGLITTVSKTLQESRLAGENGLVTAALRELHDNLGVSQQRLQALAAMGGTLGQLRQQGYVIGRTALLLKSSGCNFAVESARSVEGQQAFGDFVSGLRQLADQVGALGEDITDEAERTRTEQESLVRSITGSLSELHQLAEHSTSAVATASENIQAMMDSSASVIQQAENRARAIGRHSEDAAYFLQFGDIVRQKLEHVVDALATGAASSASISEPGSLNRLIAIQTGQLESIRTEAATAREKLAAAFNGLADETAQLVEDISVLAQNDGARGETSADSNRLHILSAEILQLQTLRTRGSELGAQSHGTAQRAADAAAKLAGHLSSVNTLNFELRLQALNAIVKTARLGAQGATLGVLSAHVHEVSQDSAASVAEILKLLDGLRSGTALLGQGSGPASAGQPNGESALERGLHDIAALHEKFHQTSDEAVSLATRQKETLADASANLEFLAAFNHRITVLIGQLQAVSACLAPHASPVEATSAREAELLVAYTMESEREVHRRVARTTESAAASPVAPPVNPPDAVSSDPSPGAATGLETANNLTVPASEGADNNVEFF